jgi:hypothetical protein
MNPGANPWRVALGQAIGGWPIAALASINGALICALLANAAFQRLWP